MLSIKMGTVTGYEIGTLLNIENVQILQVTIENDQDATPAILINPAMDESTPKTGDRVMIIKIGNFSLAIGGIDGIEPITAEGEKRLYSRDSGGDIASFITLLASGVIELNGNDDNAVRFAELESKINDLGTALNNHVHSNVIISVSGGSGAPAVGVTGNSGSPTSDLSIDITNAKIENIKVPGV